MDSLVVLRRGDFVALRDAILTIKGGRFYEKLRSGTRAKAFVYRTWPCHYVLGFRRPWHHRTMTTKSRRPSGRLFSSPWPQERAHLRRVMICLIGRQRPDEVPLPGGFPVVVPRGPPLHMEEVVDETQLRVAAVL